MNEEIDFAQIGGSPAWGGIFPIFFFKFFLFPINDYGLENIKNKAKNWR